MHQTYLDTVRLLIDVAPEVFRADCFAMKGGTALNLFVHDMPRLSVDIDLVYTHHRVARTDALGAISRALTDIAKRLKKRGMLVEIGAMDEGDEVKLFVRNGDIVVKVEVNHVFRGTVLPIERRSMAGTAKNFFAADMSVPTLSVSELYASKLVAALDRQHPRDFFDVIGMYSAGGLTPEIVECFIVYLAGHNRPVHEVLFSNDLDMKSAYVNEFEGLPVKPVTLDVLIEARARLRQDLKTALTKAQKQFLLGLVKLAPPWDLLTCKHAAELPAIRWKLQNLDRLKRANQKKFLFQEEELTRRLDPSEA